MRSSLLTPLFGSSLWTLVDAFWPLVVGAALAAGVAWLAHRLAPGSESPWLRLLQRLGGVLRRRPAKPAPATAVASSRLAALGAWVDRVEDQLRRWPVAGTGLLLLLAALLALLLLAS